MLKFTMAASLLAMTLSVDAFASYPVEPDETGTTTTPRGGPANTQQPEDRGPSLIELMRTLYKELYIRHQEQNLGRWRHVEMLKLFKIEPDEELDSTYEKIMAEYQRRKDEIHQEAETKTKDLTDLRSLGNFGASLLNSMSSEQVSLTPVDTSPLLEKKDSK